MSICQRQGAMQGAAAPAVAMQGREVLQQDIQKACMTTAGPQHSKQLLPVREGMFRAPLVMQEASAGRPADCNLHQSPVAAQDSHDVLAETLAAKLSIEHAVTLAVDTDACTETEQPAELAITHSWHARDRPAGDGLPRNDEPAVPHDQHGTVKIQTAVAGAAAGHMTASAESQQQQQQQQHPPATELLHMPPAVLQHIAACLQDCNASRLAAASSCKLLRTAMLASIQELNLSVQQLVGLSACRHRLFSASCLSVDLRGAGTAGIGVATLSQLLVAAVCQLPNVRAVELLGLSSRAMAAVVPLLLKQQHLRQLKLCGRGGPLHHLPGALQAASTAAAGCSTVTAAAFALQPYPALPFVVCNGCGFTHLTHLTLKRLNLSGKWMGKASKRPPGASDPAAADAGKALALLLQQLRQLSILSLQQVVVGPRCLTALTVLSATLQDLSLCRLQQMRLQLSPLSALTALTALQLSGLALAPVLVEDPGTDEELAPAEGGQQAAPDLAVGQDADDDDDDDGDGVEDGGGWIGAEGNVGGAGMHHQQANAAQMQQLQQATAAHDSQVADALASLAKLKRLSVSRCHGLSPALSAALPDMGQLAHLTAAMPLLPRQLLGYWGGWSSHLTLLQVQELLLTRPWQLRHPSLVALRKLTVTGLLAAPDAFLGSFAPNLTSLHVGSIRSSRVAAATAAAAERSITGMGSAGLTAAAAAVPQVAAASGPLAGIAALGPGNYLQELVVRDCGGQGSSSNSARAAAAAAAAAAEQLMWGELDDGVLVPAPDAAAGGSSRVTSQFMLGAAAVNLAALNAAGGLAAVAAAAAAAQPPPLATGGLGGATAGSAVPCGADLEALLLRLNRVHRLQLEQVAAGSRLSAQLPLWLCLWTNLAELRLQSFTDDLDCTAISAIARQHGSSLTSLSLSRCPGIHWDAVQSLAAASRLKSLSLSKLGCVTVNSVIDAICNMQQLMQLSLDGLSASWSLRQVRDCSKLSRHLAETFKVSQKWTGYGAWRNGDSSSGWAPELVSSAGSATTSCTAKNTNCSDSMGLASGHNFSSDSSAAGTANPLSTAAATVTRAPGQAAPGPGRIAASGIMCCTGASQRFTEHYDCWEFCIAEVDRQTVLAAAPQLSQLLIRP